MRRYVHSALYRLAVLGMGLSTSFCASALTPLQPGYAAHNTMMPPAGNLTFQNQTGYQSYHSGTLLDSAGLTFVRAVRGEACQRGVGLPYATVANLLFHRRVDSTFTADVRWGDGALNKAMAQAMQLALPDEVLVDVTLDLHELSVLGVVYRQRCLVVQGKLMAPALRGPIQEALDGEAL